MLCKERDVFEKVPGSDIWWIRFKVDGIEHRDRLGRRGNAINLYKIRKADMKMPANMKDKGDRFSVLAYEAIGWYINHEPKDVRRDVINRRFPKNLPSFDVALKHWNAEERTVRMMVWD